MKMRNALLFIALSLLIHLGLQAQTPTRRPTLARATATNSVPIRANLLQLMRGILYPASNVIFAAQNDNPAEVKPAKDPAMATDPLASAYGGWQAVENASLALVEAADLLTIPGRRCANGVDIPLRNPEWAKFVQGLREAGLKAYKAAQAKNQDGILDAADTMTTACANCHNRWREKPSLADRCK